MNEMRKGGVTLGSLGTAFEDDVLPNLFCIPEPQPRGWKLPVT